MDAALALHAQYASTKTLGGRLALSPPAAYLFGNPSEARYLSLFASADSFTINCVPPANRFAALPLLPAGLAFDAYTEASPVMQYGHYRTTSPRAYLVIV